MQLSRDAYIKKSISYYEDIARLLNFYIPEGAKVLEVGCASAWLLEKVSSRASKLVGIDKDAQVLSEARAQRDPKIQLIHGDFESMDLGEQFDFIIISDVAPFAYDVQSILENAQKHLAKNGRVFVSSYNSYLRPLFQAAESLGLKRKSGIENWLTKDDIANFSELSGFEIIRSGHRAMSPWNLLGLGRFLNRWLSPLPIFSLSNLYYYTLLRPKDNQARREVKSISVIVPARNEAGNIPAALSRLPRLAPHVELIFVEGNSTDNTWDAIQQTINGPHPDWVSMKCFKQDGKGKANAVHIGFREASGDIMMILDADLTMPPEELPRFVKPLITGTADFAHGSRLVYPMEQKAMRFFNILGNKFFSICFSFLLGQRFKDTLCGTKVMWKEDWNKILHLRSYFGDFDPFGDFEMIFGAVKLNHKIAEIPVHYKERTYGETNIHRWRHGMILLRMVLFAAPKMKFL